MKKIFLFIFLLCFISAGSVYADVINVLTTTADLKSITEFIGGDKVNVNSLSRGNQNYHYLSAKPSYMLQAKKADLFIKIGFDLEIGYESLILEGSRNKRIQVGEMGYLDTSKNIQALEIPEKVDRSMGDIHPYGNPHYWLDPLNAKIIASTIAERLSQIMPEERAYFQKNLNAFDQKIDQKMKEWQSALSAYQGEKIITYHKSRSYLAHRFGLVVVGELEPKPGIPPTPGHLKKIIDLVKKENVKIILYENYYSDESARFVAEKTGANTVLAPNSVGGSNEAKDYFSLIDTIVYKLKEGFEKE